MAKTSRRRSSYSLRRKRKVGRSRITRRRGRVMTLRNRKRGYPVTRNFLLYKNPLARNRMRTTLTYSTNILLNPNPEAISGSNFWVFSANNLYDPDVTSTGHQPLFFDNFAAVYEKYRVNYAKITATVVNHSVNTATANSAGTTATQPNYSYRLAILTDRTNTDIGANMEQLIEDNNPNVKWRFVAPSLTGLLPKLYSYCSPHRLNNVAFADDTLSAAVTAGPSASGAAYFIVALASADGNTDPPSVYVNIRIKYWCEFFDRKQIQAQQ